MLHGVSETPILSTEEKLDIGQQVRLVSLTVKKAPPPAEVCGQFPLGQQGVDGKGLAGNIRHHLLQHGDDHFVGLLDFVVHSGRQLSDLF